MPVFFKSSGGHLELKQPYIKLSGGWTPLKKIFQKLSTGWVEVWPSAITYTHTGYGVDLNMATLFGNPTTPGNYIFINNGVIGASNSTLGYSLRTGTFPAGSTLTFINKGKVLGVGGDGSSFTSGSGGIRHAKGGGHGLLLETYLTIDNTNGLIGGGGGGGGATGDFAGKTRHNAPGGGGQGYRGGRSKIDTWGGYTAHPGTENAPGGGYDGSMTRGRGGYLGEAGKEEVRVVNDDLSKMTIGAPGGIAIAYSGYILSGSSGIDSTKVKGRIIPGTNGRGLLAFSSFTGDGNYGSYLYVNLSTLGSGINVTASWVSGGSKIQVTKMSNNQFRFMSTEASGWGVLNTWRSGTIRFTLTSSNGSDSFEMFIRVGDMYLDYNDYYNTTCFIAGSMVTMADGTKKAIELVEIGEYVKTAIGISRVTGLQRPIVADRPLYVLEDGTFGATGDHSVWTRSPYTLEQWWGVRDIDIWRYEAEIGEGPNFGGREPFDLTDMEGQYWDFAHESGWKRSRWKRTHVPASTRLYHLLLEEGGSYFVDGILVSSMADQSGVDWNTFEWYP